MSDAIGERSIVVVAPTGRDAAVICDQLRRGSLACRIAPTLVEATKQIAEGVGALLVEEEAVTAPALAELTTVLDQQPAWSDVPIILLMTPCALRVASLTGLESLTAKHAVTFLERPVPGLTLVSTARAALSARLRQYDVRDLLDRERSAREVAELATRLRDEFVATASHELRSPLNAIGLAAEVLQQDHVSDAARKRALAAITSSAHSQQRLVDDLLDMSRLLSGNMRIAPVPTAFGTLIESALDIVRPAAVAKHIQLHVRVSTNDDVAFVDPDRMRQVLWNLLNNAVKFTPSDGHVAIALERAGDELVITVSDTGKGIKPEFLPYVFDRFRQAEQGPTTRQAGLGLGLSIARQLCELHGGTVDAYSEGEGRGAQFVVRIPAPRVSKDESSSTAIAAPT